MSNFSFLKSEWPELQTAAARVEALALTDPRGSCFYARRALELAVQWLYAHDETLRYPYADNLSALIHEPTFYALIGQALFTKARVIKDLGNAAVHSPRAIPPSDSEQATRELFHLLYWLARTYAQHGAAQMDGLVFNPGLLSAGAKHAAAQKALTLAQIQQLQAEIEARDQQIKTQALELEKTSKTAEQLDAEIKRLKAEIAQVKKQNETIPDTHDYSEAETRDFFIDLLLREAGWPLDRSEDREYPVTGMPNNQGKGFVDYVLWGDDGLPLAVVEAKRTRKDARIGRQQAKLYADCLEAQFARRPLIFYTNGYEHFFWDDTSYPPRTVQGFYKKDELELLIQRRTTKRSPSLVKINAGIVERPFQQEAIRSVCDVFEQSQRKALLVMATGSGKTRTVIALIDLLTRANHAKRILFLADRIALVNQSANAFKKFLPGCTPVNLITEKEDLASRVFLSTYPTMMGMIDEVKGKSRRFGVGHFDLIVIDEAHRSVYQKYGAIFAYFDSLLVGLTATPKAEVDKNTYRLFELENGVPTYSYELDQAVAEGYLVPPRAYSIPIKFQREGITYAALPDDEKEEWENLDWEEEVPDKVDASALNDWLFNEDTVDKVLEHLMRHGLKVEDGDRLGKTILFAKNHKHAEFIQERFDKNYPHLKGSFARVIDNHVKYAQSLIDDFSIANKEPHLAISVDMLDTGIDVPEVVNLVFFKMVRSRTKFWQMIGRGTRLCPDLFGPGQHKENFLVFDYCQNFEFFGENPKGFEGAQQEPLTKKLFLRRMELLGQVAPAAAKPQQDGSPASAPAATAHDAAVKEAALGYGNLAGELIDTLHREVSAMNLDNFIVRPERKYVETYRAREAWEALAPAQTGNVAEHLAGLPSELDPEDITARQFDLLLLSLQLALLRAEPGLPRLQKRVRDIARSLEQASGVPTVAAQMPLIQEIQTDEYWHGVTVPMLEEVRKKLRGLVKFIEKRGRTVLVTDFEDEIGEGTEMEIKELASGVNIAQYRKKVEAYLNEHREAPPILRLRFNEPLLPGDIAALEEMLYNLGGDGSKENFLRAFGQKESLGVLVRKIVGLDPAAVQHAFAAYLQDSQYNASQIRFVRSIIDYLTKNGVMDPAQLYEQPFTYISASGIDGLFTDGDGDTLLVVLDQFNQNAL